MATPKSVPTDSNFGERHQLIVAGNAVTWTQEERPKAVVALAEGDVVLKDKDGTEVTWPCVKNFSPIIRPYSVEATTAVNVIAVW